MEEVVVLVKVVCRRERARAHALPCASAAAGPIVPLSPSATTAATSPAALLDPPTTSPLRRSYTPGPNSLVINLCATEATACCSKR